MAYPPCFLTRKINVDNTEVDKAMDMPKGQQEGNKNFGRKS
jgi:hypothetical protein